MSKFINAVQASILGKKKAVDFPLLSVAMFVKEKPDDMFMSYDCLQEFRVDVNWGMQGFCRIDELPYIKQNIIHELRKALYEDIELNVLHLERAIYECDREKIFEELQNLKNEIFG